MKLEPVIPAKAGIQRLPFRKSLRAMFFMSRQQSPWIPAFAGMTVVEVRAKDRRTSKENPCAS